MARKAMIEKNKEGPEVQSACSEQVCRLWQAEGFYQEVSDVQGLL